MQSTPRVSASNVRRTSFGGGAAMVLLLAGAAAGGGAACAGVERFWTAPTGGNFSDPANWFSFDPGSPVPGPQDNAVFRIEATYTVTLTQNVVNAVLVPRNGTITLDLNGFGYQCDEVNGADDAGDTANLTITRGLVDTLFMRLATQFDTVCNVNLTSSGSILCGTQALIGDIGTSTLTLTNGGDVTAFDVYLGNFTTATGTCVVTGANSLLTVDNTLFNGFNGDGHLDVVNGGDVVCQSATFASGAGSTVTLTVDGAGSTFTCNGPLNLASAGESTVTVTNGGVMASTTAQIGFGGTSTCDVTVSGADSRWDVVGSINAGRTGDGSLLIDTGGVVTTTTSLTVAADPGSIGSLDVNGGTATLGSQLQVGRSGDALVMVRNGGVLTSTPAGSSTTTAGSLATLSDGDGEVQIIGSGSLWDCTTGFLAVGFGGEGVMTISSAGKAMSAGGFVGRNPGSVGIATVQGAQTTWTSTQDISVGLGPAGIPGGTGTLTVVGLAKVVAPNVRLGATGTLRGTGEVDAVVISAGIIEPGLSAGKLVAQDGFQQQSAGRLNIEIGGPTPETEYDILKVNGPATLGGTLNVTLLNNFDPPSGSQFDVVQMNSRTGEFGTTNLPLLSGGKIWLVDYGNSRVRLIVSGGAAPCPEDVNGDGVVGFGDLNVILGMFNTSGPNLQGDVNDDGFVNFTDLNAVLSVYNTTCP